MGLQDRDWYHESQRKREEGRWWVGGSTTKLRPKSRSRMVVWLAIIGLIAWMLFHFGHTAHARSSIAGSARIQLVSPTRGAAASSTPTFEWKVTR